MGMAELGANELTFDWDRTTISYLTQTRGPLSLGHQGGRLVYEGIEGSVTLFGHDIDLLESPLGNLLTITLEDNSDTGVLKLTVLLPGVTGPSSSAVTFETIAVKSSSPGNRPVDGAQLRYTIVPLRGTARNVIEPPLSRVSTLSQRRAVSPSQSHRDGI